jgi:radical SAM protein with 4Fe4S-binding SPASM domain
MQPELQDMYTPSKVLDSSNFRHVALHGWGEPLLNPELFQMVKHAESKGVSTELTTNATLLQTKIEEIFTSGLSTIAFGLHNKENLSVVMPQIQVDIVIYRENQDEITGLIKASAELNVDGVVLHRIFNVYKADREVGYISVQEEEELFLKVKKLAKQLKTKLFLPPEPSIPCRAVKYSIFVTSAGKITPCPYLPEFYMGDAVNGDLKKVICSERYQSFVRNMKKHPVCSKCPLGSTGGNFAATSMGALPIC